MSHRRIALVLVLAVVALCATAAAATDIPIRNWSAPPTWSAASAGRSTLADVGSPAIFIPFAPCRIADTRNAGFPATFGPPQLVGGGAARSFLIPSNPNCAGIAPGAVAFSLNFTVVAPVSTPAGGFIKAFPTGTVAPVVSTLNFGSGSILANAAVVPAGTSGGVSVAANFSTDLIIDINGYYMGGTGSLNTGERLLITGSFSGGGMVKGTNNFNGSSSYGGFFETFATTDGATGVYGDAWGATGVVTGVTGETHSATPVSAGVLGISPVANQTYGVMGRGGDASWAPFNTFLAGGRFIGSNGGANAYGAFGEGVTGGFIGRRVDTGGVPQTTGFAGYLGSDGLFTSNNLTVVGTKSFVEPHPSDPTQVIKYVALEGPEAGTYFRGRGRFRGGRATIDVPEIFRMVTDTEGLTVQVTPIGRPAAVGVVSMGLDTIEVEATRDVEFSYLVQGVRKAFRDFKPIQSDNESFYFRPQTPDEKINMTLPEELRQRMITTGIYNADGTVNLSTAERLGWAQKWRDNEAKAMAVREAAARTAAASVPGPESDSLPR